MNWKSYLQQNQILFIAKIALKLYIPIVVILLLFSLLSFKSGIPIAIFTRDPAVTAGTNGLVGSTIEATLNPFVGAISNIGILLWCAATTFCFFSFFILQKYKNKANNLSTKFSAFLVASGCLSLMLTLDDLFLFHEAIAPKILKIPQTGVYICLIGLTLWWILRFRKTIIQTQWILLLLAFLFLGFSVAIDRVVDSLAINYDYLVILSKDRVEAIEDGAKLFGIASWLGYFVAVSFQAIESILETR